ncbi:creatininase family protein [Flavonifractor sp. HCP28S3_F3]|uniref:creatininase family protein n=1 Tax=Flavonifractor sp. HCP28S3_F3 TaxID=3438939 RepID=UPI003F8B099C
MSCWLETKSWPEAEEAIKASGGVAIVPIGSVEQHSLHLPVGTDTYVAITLAEDAGEQTGAVVTPPVWFGWSPHHMVRPGTITIRPEVLADLTYDIIASLAYHGLKKIILINGHRIVNVVWMQICAERAQRELGVTVKIFDPAYMSKDIVGELGFGPVGHAEEVETSHMMYRYPEMVHLEKAKDNPITDTPLYSVDPCYTHDTLCYVPSSFAHAQKSAEVAGGATGCPTKSDAEKGRIYHEHLVKNLVAVVRSLQEQN